MADRLRAGVALAASAMLAVLLFGVIFVCRADAYRPATETELEGLTIATEEEQSGIGFSLIEVRVSGDGEWATATIHPDLPPRQAQDALAVYRLAAPTRWREVELNSELCFGGVLANEGMYQATAEDLGIEHCPRHPPPSPRVRKVVLGGKVYGAPTGSGWGAANPHFIYNGGDASGSITHVHWSSWGGAVAHGQGLHPVFRPNGGYFRRPVVAQLKAIRIGRCEGRDAYLRLLIREPRRPGGPLGPWRSWAGPQTICEPYGSSFG